MDLTTDEALEKGDSTWSNERLMITSLRPDFKASKLQVEAVETKMYHKYAFISKITLGYTGSAEKYRPS